MHVHSVPYYLTLYQNCVGAIPNLNLPDVCTATPQRGQAFCKDHCILIKKDVPDVPTGLREFIKYCRSGKHDLMSFQGLYNNVICICIYTTVFTV